MSVFFQCHSIIIDQDISAPVNVKEVVYGCNYIGKRYIYELMSNVQLPGSRTFDSQILMHSCTPKNDVGLAKEPQKHLSKENSKHGIIDKGNYRKISSKRKWTDREYHVQDNADVAHKYLKMYCDTNQFLTLPFCGSHKNHHGAKGLSKHYHLRFDPKLGHGIFEIDHILCAYIACTSMLEKPWISGIQSKK